MKESLFNRLLQFIILAVWSADPGAQGLQTGVLPHRYPAPNGAMNIAILASDKQLQRAAYESRIEFQTAGGRLFCALDYSSEDGEHGFGVVKGQWTPDSQFFVFSLTSSGGHQAWHSPTQFYDRQNRTVRTLDDYLPGLGISTSDFQLIPQNTVKTAVWDNKSVSLTVRLSTLPALSGRTKKPFVAQCAGGRTIKVESP